MSQANFTGEVSSDFMKKVLIPDARKDTLIDYSATDFLSLRSSIIEYIKAVYPLDYENFSETDLGMMLVEVVAYLGSVLSFKADMLTNESFLATARNRRNVQKLLDLVGIQMRGPLAAAANASVTSATQIGSGKSFSIPPEKRIITIISPEDGGQVTYTLYKIINGRIQDASPNSTIELYQEESIDSGNTWNNVALLEGSFAVQTGTFTSFDSVKSIALNSGPIIEGSVQVFVDAPNSVETSGAYTRVDNLFLSTGATDKIFQVNLDDSFGGTIVFGDDITGVSPAINSDYTVNYRVGGGTRGNVRNGYINAETEGDLVGGSINLTIQNTSLATGGSNAESIDHAKRWGPLYFKSQDRLVTLEDYTARASRFISSYGTMGKVTAAVRKAYSSANIIDVYTLEKASDLQLQQATTSFKMELLDNLKEKKMLTDDIVIVDGVIRSLDLVITVSIESYLFPQESRIKTEVRDAVVSYFNNENFDFGTSFRSVDFTKSISTEVPDARYVEVDNIPKEISVDFNEVIQLNNVVINVTEI